MRIITSKTARDLGMRVAAEAVKHIKAAIEKMAARVPYYPQVRLSLIPWRIW